jgi:hypothetical protein
MTSILKNIYAVQDIVPKVELEHWSYPDLNLTWLIADRIEQLTEAVRDKGENVDWGTLAITTRWDDSVGGLLISTRVNPI